MSERQPIRILHVLGGLDRGGIETWLMHVLRHIDHERFRMDFLIRTGRTCAYEEEARALGAQILRCTPRKPWLAEKRFTRLLHEHGPYDVVHSHGYHYSTGLFLGAAQRAGVTTRIAHSHSESQVYHTDNTLEKLYHFGYTAITNYWIAQFASQGMACSKRAAAAMFGAKWQKDPRWHVLYSGTDLTHFHDADRHTEVRREFGIPDDAFVVGHVGRIVPPKNHAFLIEVARELVQRDPSVYVLLVGDGPLRPAIEAKVTEAGLTERVIFTGVRADVPRLLLGAMDLFLFPSISEGLGMVAVEAQAAGLPCIIADGIPEDVDVIPSLITRQSLRAPASQWAETILKIKETPPPLSQRQACRLIEESAFNIQTSVQRLQEIYSGPGTADVPSA